MALLPINYRPTGTFATQPRTRKERLMFKHFEIFFFGERKVKATRLGFWRFTIFAEDKKKALKTARIFFRINKFYEIGEI